ncbi:hypothetical protein [uncultured Methanospirillum sp.]|nr:hypothetical protein [uncultured Methanospirillum sp.]
MNIAKTDNPRTPILHLGGSGMMAGEYFQYCIDRTSIFLSPGGCEHGSC